VAFSGTDEPRPYFVLFTFIATDRIWPSRDLSHSRNDLEDIPAKQIVKRDAKEVPYCRSGNAAASVAPFPHDNPVQASAILICLTQRA
jgi:hypothetical protein